MVTSEPFYSVTTIGKQPLLLWLYGLFVQLSPYPLFFSRLLSILAGLGTLVFIRRLGFYLGGAEVAAVTGAFYVFSPIFILFDSLAVVDGVLTFLYTILVYTLHRLTVKFSLPYVILVACLIGAGLWIKSTVVLFFIISFMVIAFSLIRHKASYVVVIFTILAQIVIPMFILIPLIANKEFVHMFRFQAGYAMTIPEILLLPINTWTQNVISASMIYLGYTSPIIVITALISLIRKGKVRLTGIIFISSFLLLILTARALNSRYVVFSAILLLPLAASILVKKRILVLVTILSMGLFSLLLIFRPVTFFGLYPQIGVWKGENWQHINGWPSGYGVMEALEFVHNHRQGRNALIGVRWDSGNPEDTVLLFANKYPGLEATFIDVKLARESEMILQQYKEQPVYYITRDYQYGGLEKMLTLLARFPKPDGKEAVEVYQVRY